MLSSAVAGLRRSLDREAFLQLVTPVLPAAHRLAFGMLAGAHDAEDAVQSALLKAWKARDTFRPGAEPRPWLLAIVANECRQQRRSPWWRLLRSETPDRHTGRPGGRLPEEVIDLRRAVAGLRPDLRSVVVLRYYLDLDFEEVGRVLGCTSVAARTRMHRALRQLRLDFDVLEP